jgi:5-methylcytosine-specific restriction endonuclease McrA
MSWTYQPDRLKKPAPSVIERDERRASRETTYRKASAAARLRDGSRCRLCGDHRTLETHHVEPRSTVGRSKRDTLPNLITLCNSCHREVTTHVIKLHPGPDGANGLIRAERYSKPHKDWLEVRREA